MRDEKEKKNRPRRATCAMGDDGAPPPLPPAVDAVTVAQTALETAVRLMFETAGTTQRDGPPASVAGEPAPAGSARTTTANAAAAARAGGAAVVDAIAKLAAACDALPSDGGPGAEAELAAAAAAADAAAAAHTRLDAARAAVAARLAGGQAVYSVLADAELARRAES